MVTSPVDELIVHTEVVFDVNVLSPSELESGEVEMDTVNAESP
jgi:hypothetical protein